MNFAHTMKSVPFQCGAESNGFGLGLVPTHATVGAEIQIPTPWS